MINPRINYTKIALEIASNYSLIAIQEIEQETDKVSTLVNHLQDITEDFPNNLINVNEGQLIVYGNNEYISVYDGVGGCYGSSLTPGEVLHYDNCLDIGENLIPTKIIRI